MSIKDVIFLEEQDYLSKTQQAMQGHIDFLQANPDFATGSFSEMLYGDVVRSRDRNANRKEYGEYCELLQCPYVGRMDFAVLGDGEKSLNAYIGEKSIYIDKFFYVYDWRTPVGQRFYMKNELKFSYNSFEYQLLLRRALFIQNGKLEAYDTEYQHSSYKGRGNYAQGEQMGIDMVTEPFLIRILNEKRKSQELTPIIISMQEEQNNINRLPPGENIIVQGCAGSGKTMVLLHRLSYLKFNNPDLSWDRVKVLTPNEVFNTHINALSQRLELSKIERITIEKYYGNLLAEYEEHLISLMVIPLTQKNKEKRLARARVEKLASQIKSERELDKNFLAFVYSDDFYDRLREKYSENWAKYEAKVAFGHIDKINENYGFNKNISFGNNTYKKIDTYLQTISAILSGENSAREMIVQRLERVATLEEKIKRDRDYMDRTSGERGKIFDEIKQLAKEVVDENLRNNEPNTVKNVGRINWLAPNLEWHFHTLGIPHKALEGSYKRVTACSDEMMSVRARTNDNCSALTQLQDEIAKLSEKILCEGSYKRLIEAKTQLEEFSVDRIFQGTMEDVLGDDFSKNFAEIKEPMKYRFYFYAKILFFYQLYGKIRTADSLLAIDEGQDLSPSEYNLLSMVNGNVVFNIYGDTGQLIKEGRGTDSWNKLDPSGAFSRFELNINYRNTVQIADYCNKRLGLSNVAVGINGVDVETLDIFDLPHIDLHSPDKRTALICKDLKAPYIKRIIDGLKKAEEVVLGKIEKGRVSIIDIETSKGLEFDKVYVVPRDMTHNEQYIAYTRALSELVVVE